MTTWVGTSWKMNKTLAEALAFAEALAAFVPGLDARIQPFVIPSFTAVREVKRALAATRVKVGAQNMHWADAGAWTGEVSPLQLRDCGLDLIELGHSERREHFGETDETVGLKTEAAVRHGFVPLICVGETLAERESGRADEVLAAPDPRAPCSSSTRRSARATILFAYEPVWAIGEKGIPATSDYADARQQADQARRGRGAARRAAGALRRQRQPRQRRRADRAAARRRPVHRPLGVAARRLHRHPSSLVAAI